jgi:hypothetical protein
LLPSEKQKITTKAAKDTKKCREEKQGIAEIPLWSFFVVLVGLVVRVSSFMRGTLPLAAGLKMNG